MNPKQNIIVIGASGHAKVIIEIIEKENKYHIVGLIDSYKSKENKIYDYEILGTRGSVTIASDEYFGYIDIKLINNANNILRSQDLILTLISSSWASVLDSR